MTDGFTSDDDTGIHVTSVSDSHVYFVPTERTLRNSVPSGFKVAAMLTLAAVGTTILIASLPDKTKEGETAYSTQEIQLAAASLGLIIALLAGYLLVAWARYYRNENKRFDESLRAQKKYEAKVLEKLQETTKLATLMDLNQGQIKDYHRIVTRQADKSFRSSQAAMGIGVAMLVVCLASGFIVDAAQIRWFIAGLATLSTTMAGFLNRTYIGMYRDCIRQLNRYFDQPVLNSYFLTAERLSEGLKEFEAGPAHEIRVRLIEEVIATSSRMSQRGTDTRNTPPDPA